MPKPPNLIDKWQFISKFIDNPCHAPWTVYFETALPFLGQAVMELLLFDLTDIVRAYARPRSARGRPHGPGRRRGRPRGGGIPEIGEMIGKRLPGAQRAAGRFVDDGVRHLWMIDGVLQRLLWYYLIADVATDFAYNWTSAIQSSRYCTKGGGGMGKQKELWFKAQNPVCGGTNNWEWMYPFSGPVVSSGVSPGPQGGYIIVAGGLVPEIGARAWLRTAGGGNINTTSSQFMGLIPGLEYQAVARGQSIHGNAGAPELCSEGGFVEARGVTIVAIPYR